MVPLPRLKAYDPGHQPTMEEETLEPAAKLPEMKPVEEEPGRPYEDYVNGEARRFWQEIGKQHNLTKPAAQEIRAAAMTILCHARRRRTGGSPRYRAHLAVDAVQLHALEQGRIKPPDSRLGAYPDHLDALIQLAHDLSLLAWEIPLPEHPPPQHPPIYYTMFPGTDRPAPREDSLIRGDYVYTPDGMRITEDEYIYPWIDPFVCVPTINDMLDNGWDACYTLSLGRENLPEIEVHWIKRKHGFSTHEWDSLHSLRFSPYPSPLPSSCVIL